jgi:hypothetical protein
VGAARLVLIIWNWNFCSSRGSRCGCVPWNHLWNDSTSTSTAITGARPGWNGPLNGSCQDPGNRCFLAERGGTPLRPIPIRLFLNSIRMEAESLKLAENAWKHVSTSVLVTNLVFCSVKLCTMSASSRPSRYNFCHYYFKTVLELCTESRTFCGLC